MALTLENEFVVEAGLDTTWETLLDLSRVAQCLPGASVEPAGEGGSYRGTMKVKLGPVSMAYEGTAVLTEVDEANRVAAFSVQGKEIRGQGTAAATVRNSLVPEGDATRVLVQTELTVTGRPAQFGRGIMQDVAGRMLSDFAACLSREISAPRAAEEAPAAAPGERGPRAAEPAAAGTPPPGPPPVDVLDLSGPMRSALAGRLGRALCLAALVVVSLALIGCLRRRGSGR